MRELLQQALDALNTCAHNVIEVRGNGRAVYYFDTAKVQAVKEAIETALSRSKWVKVADGLPVVPEGEQRVAVWVCCSNEVLPEMFWSSDGKWWGFEKYGFTHWQYRQDDTPAPPEAE